MNVMIDHNCVCKVQKLHEVVLDSAIFLSVASQLASAINEEKVICYQLELGK